MSKNDRIVADLLHDKVVAVRQQLEWLEQLERDITAVSHGGDPSVSVALSGNGQRTRNRGNLRQVVTNVIEQAPDRKMKREDIIKAVQALLPGTLPIGVVSTLATKSLFKKVDGDSYVLKAQK